MKPVEIDKEHRYREQSKWYGKVYRVRHEFFDCYADAAFYKYLKGFDGHLLDAGQRERFQKAHIKREPEDFSSEELRAFSLSFEKFLEAELLKQGPSIPEYPVLDWLAKSIFRWYWPALWTVDMNAPDWISQIRDADRDRAFSYAECEAYAVKKRLEIGPVERLLLRVVTREGTFRDVRRRVSWDPPTPYLPITLEGYRLPTLIMSSELRRALSRNKAQAKAHRRLTRDELEGSWPKKLRARKKFTPSGSVKRQFLKMEREDT